MSKLLIPESPLQILPSLAKAIGLNEAIFIQQLHYWSLKSKDGWVYNTYEQWQEQFPFWSTRTIQRIVRNLEETGLLISRQDNDYDRKKYYQIDYDKLDEVELTMTPSCPHPSRQVETLLITETTTLDSDLQSVEPESKPKPKPKRKSKHPIEAIRPLATAVADATSLKYSDNIPMLHKVASRLLDNGYTPEKVAEFSAWWQTEDWRGKKGQPPTPWQVQSMIGILDKQEGDEQDSEKRERFLRQLEQEQK